MAASVNTSGATALTVGTSEQTLATITAAGTYQLVVDAATAAAGDVILARIYGKARSTDTERLMDEHAVAVGAPARPLWTSKPYLSPHHIRFALLQTAGSSRTPPWAVYAA